MARKKFYGPKALYQDDDIFIAAGDVETEGLGGRLLMVQWGFMGEVFHATGPNMLDEFFGFVMDKPKPVIWYFHFGQYDWRYFLSYIVEKEYDVEIGLRTETDIYEIRLREPGTRPWVVLRDSYALWPNTLEKLAECFCPEIPKLEIDIANFDPENPEHVKYARRDIEILLTGLPRLFDMLNEHFGVNPGATTAGTAIKAWQRSLPYEQIFNPLGYGPTEVFIRQAYYGGLVFLTTQKVQVDVETYDLNSSYPASMCDYGVPYGAAIKSTDYMTGKMGIYRVRVRAPENLIVPILPARDKRGGMRWYCGEFETVVTNRELVFAAKNGYEILEVFEGIVFEETIFPFNDFVDKCKLIRNCFKGKPEEILAKIMQNSSYGKFGARRERLRMLHGLNSDDDDLAGAAPYDDAGLWYVKKELDEDMLCMPHWAVFITAHSRLRLLQTVYSIGPENCIYGDTDSITVRKGFADKIDVGDEYGQWKLEKEWQYFRAIAPKVYSGVLADGTFKGAAKGLPRKGIGEKQWRELLENGRSHATALSLDSLRVAMRKGVMPARELTRVSSSLDNSTNFKLLSDGAVRVKLPNEK